MNMALIMTAVQQGAMVANYAEVTELHKDSVGNGKLYGARVKDKLTGEEFDVRAKVSRSLNGSLWCWAEP
jgi:glycerol-3-phosphate dehydrogenase